LGLFQAALKIFCHIFWLPLLYSQGLRSEKCVASIQGVSLLKHSYNSSVVKNMFVCYYKCKDDNLCQSLNFYRDKNLCELNNRTHTVSLPLNFVPNSNAFYLENPYRAFLGLSSLQPAVSCGEIKNASEGLAPSGRYWLDPGGSGNKPFKAYCDMEQAVVVECTGTPCNNGATCDYQGDGKYSCRCQPGYSGSHCETEINECSSNPCLNGGTCTDKLNGFSCACTSYFTGARCEDGLGAECNSYTLNEEVDRSVTHATVGSTYKCDSALVTAWYRFNSTAGSKMPTYCVASNKCNTHASGWLNGTHPTPKDSVVRRNVCFNWSGNCCNWQISISVRNCGLFYVYRLEKPPACHLRYCVTK